MSNLDNLCINSIRILSAEAIQKAKSGHPGLPMGAAPMVFELWAKHMRHNPKNPEWKNRDRFILSAGHGSMLLYSLLYMFEYGLTMEDLKNFRQIDSKTPGHPEFGHTIGVDTTTGPLGQGFANGVGMAIAEAHLAAKFNKPGYNVVDHYTYVLSGDGCMMEGITSEAASLAGTLGLGKLIVFYDSNSISIEGCTDIAFTEDTAKRFEAYGWQVLSVEDGNNIKEIGEAIEKAKITSDKPAIIIVKTLIGYGCPTKQGKASAHGEPLGEENIKLTREYLKWEVESSFQVPDTVTEYMKETVRDLSVYEQEWNKLWSSYTENYPQLAKEFNEWYSNSFSEALINNEELWEFDDKPMATRNISGDIINRLSVMIPNLIGGSADLAPSNKTEIKNRSHFSKENPSGSNMHFGVREHAMAAIGNGMVLHGGLKPYVATFFVFSDYMKGAMRLSAIMKLPLIYVLTHDSIGVGEDGPTHEPIEQLAAIRSTPDFIDFRPCDATETVAAWYTAITAKYPTAIMLTRQNLPQIKGSSKDAMKGGYIISESEKSLPDIILIASGSEVHLAIDAKNILKDRGVDARVVSLPSFKLFDQQSEAYKELVLPKAIRARLAVEALSSFGWHKYTGLDGDILAMDTFGISGPYTEVFIRFGFTVDKVVEKAMKILGA